MRSSDDGERREEARRARERQREEQRHLRQLEFDDEGNLSREFVESMIDTSVLEEGTVEILRNYLSRQWILSNMNDAEVHDIKYKLYVMKLKVRGAHPPSESAIQGPIRAFLFDDADEELYSLNSRQKDEIESFFDTIRFAIVPRSRGGFEREQLISKVRESRTQRDDKEESSGRLGLF